MNKSIYPVITKEKALPFYLTGIGISDPEYHVYREKGLTSFQILFTTKGSGILICQDKKIRLKKNDVLYMPPEIIHEYYPEKDEWETNWLVFRGNYLPDLMKNLGFESWFVKNFKDLQPITNIFKKILDIAEISGSSEKCSQLIYEYVLTLRKMTFINIDVFSNQNIQNAINFIDEKYTTDLTIEQLSKAAGLSVQHFCRMFHKIVGMRPLEYIAKKRISQAKNLLENSDMSIAEIGKLVGYHAQNYFGIIFKKQEGVSPGQWKK